MSNKLRKLGELDLDDQKAWVQGVAERAEVFKNEIPMAMKNLATAKAWDRLRYACTRGGTYRPKPKQYWVGDLVYVKRKSTDTLDCSASPIILQIIWIKPDYTLVLRGRDGPCYLPDVSDEYDPARVEPEADHRCEVVRGAEKCEWVGE